MLLNIIDQFTQNLDLLINSPEDLPTFSACFKTKLLLKNRFKSQWNDFPNTWEASKKILKDRSPMNIFYYKICRNKSLLINASETFRNFSTSFIWGIGEAPHYELLIIHNCLDVSQYQETDSHNFEPHLHFYFLHYNLFPYSKMVAMLLTSIKRKKKLSKHGKIILLERGNLSTSLHYRNKKFEFAISKTKWQLSISEYLSGQIVAVWIAIKIKIKRH